MKYLIWVMMLVATATAQVQANDRIVAVVNDQVITLNQLNARTALNMRQLGMANPNEQQHAAVTKRTLSGLIDEELQRQYATSARVKMAPQDIAATKDNAIKAVGGQASWNSLTKGLEQTANDKLAAETIWQKIIARDVQPRVQIGTAEADRLITELAKSRHVLDREISVIQLNSGSDSTGDKAQLDKLGELKQKIANGENFNDLARVYSDDKSAASGGNLGWFGSGELNPQLEEALDKMQPGQISEPIRTPMGWYLVKLENVRTTKPVETGPQTQLELFLLAVKQSEDPKEAKAIEAKLAKQTAALRKGADVKAYFDKADFKDDFAASQALGWVVQSDLEPELAKALEDIQPGNWSKSVAVNGNVARVFVADTKQAMPAKLGAYRERVMNNMFGNRVELESRRFMQNLRQRAFLDVRL